MNGATLCCATDSRRREQVRKAELNGIDYLEVDCGQTELTVYFLGRAPDWIEPGHIRIEGGVRERGIKVTGLDLYRSEDAGVDDFMTVRVDRPGDFSTYRLRILGRDGQGRPTDTPPTDFDPRYAALAFSFKASCPGDVDCAELPLCPPPAFAEPEIDYLAKDYASFRRLMLDRMSLTLPDWCERHGPDMTIALVELLAYVGDHLSYHQDAVGAEAFLDTARRRISVARHARLVDYRLQEGCNARAWIVLEATDAEFTMDAGDIAFVTAWPGHSGAMLKAADLGVDLPGPCVLFEPLLPPGQSSVTVRSARNAIEFYDWGEAECCLPAGATSATLRDPGKLPPPDAKKPDKCHCPGSEPPEETRQEVGDGRWHQLKLAAGEILIFEEQLGPRTGIAADADPSHRHAVRLTRAAPSLDPLTGDLLYEVEWCAEDALPFPLCLSARLDPPDCEYIRGLSVARGNVVLADSGCRVEEDLAEVPTKHVVRRCEDDCDAAEEGRVAGRYRPHLSLSDPTFAAPYAPVIPVQGGCRGAAAAAALSQDPGSCLPQLTLTEGPGPARTWLPKLDLLASGPDDRHFVVETDEERVAWLRFGDGVNGRAPEAGQLFRATCRSGSGTAGNVAADTLRQIVFRNHYPDGTSIAVRNPMPARGGTGPEPAARAKLRAPLHFHKALERAVAPDDYAAIVMRDFPAQVQRAAARLRSSGAAVEVQVAIDAFAGDADAVLLSLIERHLERYRRIGHDVRAIPAKVVPLLLELTVCVRPAYLRGHIKAALQRVLGSGLWPGGVGFFHIDSTSFGDRITLSRIAAAAHRVEGVASIVVTRLERLREGENGEVAAGELALGPFEVPRLDNDLRFPENGALILNLRGGR